MSVTNRDLLDFAVEVAWQAGKVTLEYFQTKLTPEIKSDQSPVTIADKRTEQTIRELICAKFPDHSIVGEEYGEQTGQSEYRWIIDPIDGTQSFIRGVPFYGVLIGIEKDDEIVVGVINYPALGETLYAATGEGCYWNGRRANVSQVKDLGDALFLNTGVELFYQTGRGKAYERLANATSRQRTWGDCYGYALVATGRAELMIDPIMKVWDCAPLLPIMREAGGTFTDWKGVSTIRGGDSIATNGFIVDEVFKLIQMDE
ncbi:MAG TPA: histidinol-phosphatase [Blastocatellia bacterium]|nr:histidinol-phosphatase [Blastocatellia bacterium]